MPLGPPSIVGPVSTCSSHIRVVGQFSGSRVRIFIEGDVVPLADTVVGWADAVIAIDHSRLVPGRKLVAEQILVFETSERSSSGQLVELAVNGPVTIPHPVYACAQSLFVTGCCAGARLQVWQNGGMLGFADAVGDQAWIAFNPGKRIESWSAVEVRQLICTSLTPVTTTIAMPAPAPIQGQMYLDPPRIIKPLEECQRLVPIEAIVPGAVVRLLRRDAVIFESSVPVPAFNILADPLAEGEDFAVSQLMPRCEVHPGWADIAKVQNLAALKPPRIDGPICAGPHQIVVSRLKPGATLRLFAGSTEIGRWEAGAFSMPVDIDVPAPPVTLTARQELCGIVSPMSRPYTIASARSGRWFFVEDENGDNLEAKSFAIHVALARTGKIVIFSGDQHSHDQNKAQDIDHCELFDCGTLTLKKIDAPSTDVFCSGHAFLPDGRLLVAGGTESFFPEGDHEKHVPGLRDAWIFSPTPSASGKYWSKVACMRRGRWYPTLVTLASGEVLALSGHPESTDPTDHNNDSMETYRPNTWTHVGDSADIVSYTDKYYYPRLFVGPTGEVFSATPLEPDDERLPGRSATWTPGSGPHWIPSAPPVGTNWGLYEHYFTASVLLPLIEKDEPLLGAVGIPRNQRSFSFDVLLAGEPAPWITSLGTPRAPEANPTWRAFPPRKRRLNSNLVLLPSGEVFLCGGVGNVDDDDTAVKAPEMLIRGADGNWTWEEATLASAEIPRNYHSTALLMPDGRVFTGGSSKNREPGDASFRQLSLEIYEPWYVCMERPKILSAPDSVGPGERLLVRVKSNEPIKQLAMIRAGSATHAFNSDQRYIGLIARPIESGSYAGIVPGPAVAVPGYYLVFACTEKNVPSKGVFVRVRPAS